MLGGYLNRCMCTMCPRRQEAGVRSPGPGAADGLSCHVGAGIVTQSSVRIEGALNIEQAHQPFLVFCSICLGEVLSIWSTGSWDPLYRTGSFPIQRSTCFCFWRLLGLQVCITMPGFIVLKICFYLCGCVCCVSVWMNTICIWCLRRPEESVGFPGTGVTGCCQSPDLDVGDLIQVLWKAASAPNCGTLSLATGADALLLVLGIEPGASYMLSKCPATGYNTLFIYFETG